MKIPFGLESSGYYIILELKTQIADGNYLLEDLNN